MLGHDEPITFDHMMELIERLKSELKEEDHMILMAIEESVWRLNDLLE